MKNKNKLGVLYKATDPQGHCYIGQRRGDGHDVGVSYFGSGTYVKRAIKVHGKDYFTYWVFAEKLTQEERDNGEIYYIKFFQSTIKENGYNIRLGGSSGDNFSNLSDEEKIERINKVKTTNNNKSEEEKAEINRKKSVSGKIAQNRPEVKEHTKEMSLISQNRPEVKKKNADGVRKAFKDPVKRANKSEKAKIANNRPGAREKNSKAVKEAYKNPEMKKKQLENTPKGENHNRAKLTWEQVRLIRELYKMDPRFYKTHHLKGLFKVSRHIIYRIINKITWKE